MLENEEGKKKPLLTNAQQKALRRPVSMCKSGCPFAIADMNDNNMRQLQCGEGISPIGNGTRKVQ